MGCRSSPCNTRTIFFMDFRCPPCRNRKNSNFFLWFLAVYTVNKGIIFRGYTQSTVQIQELYVFFSFCGPPYEHNGSIYSYFPFFSRSNMHTHRENTLLMLWPIPANPSNSLFSTALINDALFFLNYWHYCSQIITY